MKQAQTTNDCSMHDLSILPGLGHGTVACVAHDSVSSHDLICYDNILDAES